MSRDRLLSPHIERFEVWQQLAESLNQVWLALGIDSSIEQLKLLRSPINVRDVVSGSSGVLTSLDTVPQQDRTSLVLTADLLGFRYYETGLLDTQDYLRLCRHLAEYYANDKGTPVFTDFLGWCLNAHFSIMTTWTTDYKTFLTDGDPAIGVSIDRGGPWYPTTHVVLEYDQNRFSGVRPGQLVNFFNYFANVNLVFYLTQLGGTETIPIEAAVVGSLVCEYPSTSTV